MTSPTYTYEMWKGNKIVGQFSTHTKLEGKSVRIPRSPAFKTSYDKKYLYVDIPMKMRLVYDDGINIKARRVLDVTRKSKKQINLIKWASIS